MGAIFMSTAAIFYGVIQPLLKKAGFNALTTIVIQIFTLWVSILLPFIATRSYTALFTNKQGILILDT